MLTKTKISQIILSIIFLWDCSQISVNNNSNAISPKTSHVTVKTGLDVLLESHIDDLFGKRIALVTNHSGIDKNGNSNIALLYTKNAVQIETIFTPEHGFTGDIPAGYYIDYDSISSEIPPIFSLYGKTRKPTNEMLKNVDLIIYDIQDIGARFYTYISTLGFVIEAAGEANIPVIVLDRPNPIGGNVNGPILNENYKSFIGNYPIPIQYGMTVAELAKMIVGEKMIDPITELTIIPMENYNWNLYFDETNLPWANPSPNIPNLETAIIYPGFCLFEATNISEGRGTNNPFKQIGAPWIDSDILINLLNKQNLSGVRFNPIQFTPISISTMSKYPKYENEHCNGIEINVTDRDIYKSVLTGVTVLWALNKLYPDSITINKNSLGRLWGSDVLFTQLREYKTPTEIVESYQSELEQFLKIREKYLIYK